MAINYEKLPRHIAIIMDGNGRWAKKRLLPRNLGHKAGVEAIRGIVKHCDKIGIKYLTLYAFSTENWSRSEDEVSGLMKLLSIYLEKETKELIKNNVIINYIGDISRLAPEIQAKLEDAKENSRDNTGVVLTFALNYGSRNEIINAVKAISDEVVKGKISKDEINEDLFSKFLYTSNIPDPDLMIRPSGEKRISNFLLWQIAYSEFYYDDILWPDFKPEDLDKAIEEYQRRDRRFGGVK